MFSDISEQKTCNKYMWSSNSLVSDAVTLVLGARFSVWFGEAAAIMQLQFVTFVKISKKSLENIP